MAEPPLCTLQELKTTLTIDDLADLHEILNIKELATLKAKQEAERKSNK